jgi:hypothetical protein
VVFYVEKIVLLKHIEVLDLLQTVFHECVHSTTVKGKKRLSSKVKRGATLLKNPDYYAPESFTPIHLISINLKQIKKRVLFTKI